MGKLGSTQHSFKVSSKNKMVDQNYLLNYFVAGARQVLNLVNHNKKYARKHTAILQVMTT